MNDPHAKKDVIGPSGDAHLVKSGEIAMRITLLTVHQAAQQLQVMPETIRCWLRTGKLRGVKLGDGGPWRIHQQELAKLLKKGWE